MSLAAIRLMATRQTLPNFRLATVAASVGVSVEDKGLHDALYDVRIMRELFLRLGGTGMGATRGVPRPGGRAPES